MRTASVWLAIIVALLWITTPMFAQHEEHAQAGAPAAGVSPELVSTCVDSQRETLAVIDAANGRLETARQTNSAAEIRAALADLQRALLEARTALTRCTELQHALAAAPAAAAPAAAAPAAPPSSSAPRSTSAPPSAAPSAPANHMVMVQTAFDPAKLSCSPKIDPKTAAKTTYEGKTYYFCSTKDRDEFLTDPKMSLSMMPPKQ